MLRTALRCHVMTAVRPIRAQRAVATASLNVAPAKKESEVIVRPKIESESKFVAILRAFCSSAFCLWLFRFVLACLSALVSTLENGHLRCCNVHVVTLFAASFFAHHLF